MRISSVEKEMFFSKGQLFLWLNLGFCISDNDKSWRIKTSKTEAEIRPFCWAPAFSYRCQKNSCLIYTLHLISNLIFLSPQDLWLSNNILDVGFGLITNNHFVLLMCIVHKKPNLYSETLNLGIIWPDHRYLPIRRVDPRGCVSAEARQLVV